MTAEHCTVCGFDPDHYNRADTISSQRIVPAVLAAATEGLGEAALTHVDETGISIADHLARVDSTARSVVASLLRTIESKAEVEGDSPYEGIHAVLTDVGEEQWQLAAEHDGQARTVRWLALAALEQGFHTLALIGRQRAGFGRGAQLQTGTVHQLNISSGGVPKLPVGSIEVDPTGIQGDLQGDRRHHGRPVQAVCLWSEDVIAGLVTDGHPIAAGSAGENVTVSGVNWPSLLPGTRISVGHVPMMITAHAIPCSKNAQWFSDRDFGRILHDRNPGLSRLYAIPLGSGTVSVGDPVVVEALGPGE